MRPLKLLVCCAYSTQRLGGANDMVCRMFPSLRWQSTLLWDEPDEDAVKTIMSPPTECLTTSFDLD